MPRVQYSLFGFHSVSSKIKIVIVLYVALLGLTGQNVGANAQEAAPKDAILIHGIFSEVEETWKELKIRLPDEGIYTWTIDFGSDPLTMSNEAPIALEAQALSQYIKKVVTTTGRHSVSLVCHSMGGLAARYYLEHPALWPTPDSAQVGRLIMLGTPNWGADVSMQNPVVAVMAARGAAKGNKRNIDKYDNWCQSIKDMFAEWQPAPREDTSGKIGYPEGFRLGKWDYVNDKTGFVGPMSEGKFRNSNLWKATRLLVDLKLLAPNGEDRKAITEVFAKFQNIGKRDTMHRTYYKDTAESLGVLYPPEATINSWGVGSRYVSPFLAELNIPGSDKSGARIYLIAGARSKVFVPILNTYLDAPYTSLSSDGIVTVQSVLGVDPISGACLFPLINGVRVFNVIHADLPHYAPAINTVVQWLKEK